LLEQSAMHFLATALSKHRDNLHVKLEITIITAMDETEIPGHMTSLRDNWFLDVYV
jgi:hypothetical protein